MQVAEKQRTHKKTVAAATEESITCGEWYDLLASNFGAVNSETEKPYFSNITKENNLFAKIQTLVEFGVIDKENELNLDDYVTYKEMALNALALLGTDIIGDYLKTDKNLKEDDLLQFAKDKKIVSKTDNNYATKEDAQTAIDTTVNLYVNRPITDKQDTKLKSGVKDIRKNDVLYENENVTINDKTKVKAGDIIILPASDEYPMGLARKVTAVNGNILTTTEPELDEVYEKIDISATVVPKISEITPLESGVSIEEYSDIEGLNTNTEPKIISLSNNSETTPLAKESKGLSFSIPINITKNKLSIDAKWSGLTLEMSKQNTKLDKNNIPFAYDKNGNQYTQKYTGGLEIKGKITIENLKFDVDVDWSAKDVIKSVSISPKFTTKVDLSIKGKAEGEELSVFKTSVPIGSTGVWVDCIFVVKVEVNGDITIKTKMMSESCVSYKKGKGVTTVSNKNNFDNKAQISGNLTVGVGPKTVITVLGIDIADATLVLGLGAKGTLKATVGSTELPCMDVKAYGPTATFSLGKDKTTLLNKLGVTIKVKLIDLEDALLKPIWTTTYHWESNNGWMKSSECTGNKKNEENSATNSSPSNSSSNNDETVSSNSENQTVSSDTNSSDLQSNSAQSSQTDDLPSVFTLKKEEMDNIVEIFNYGFTPKELTYIVYQNPETKFEISKIRVNKIMVDNTEAEFRQSTDISKFCYDTDVTDVFQYMDRFNIDKAANIFTLKCPESVSNSKDCVKDHIICDGSCGVDVTISLKISISGYSDELPYTYRLSGWTMCCGYGYVTIPFETFE